MSGKTDLSVLDLASHLPEVERKQILRRLDGLTAEQTTTLLTALRAEALRRCERDGLLWLKFVRTRDETDPLNTVKPFPVELEYVQQLWRLIHDHQRIVIVKSRQMLMSWIACAYCVWHARFHPNQFVVWQSQKEQDAFKMVCVAGGEKAGYLGRMQFLERHLPPWMRMTVKESQGAIDYPNGSRIEGIPGGADQVRGKVPSIIVEDEYAYQPEAKGVYVAVAPLIQKATKFIAISTPAGFTGNQFAALYHGLSLGDAQA